MKKRIYVGATGETVSKKAYEKERLKPQDFIIPKETLFVSLQKFTYKEWNMRFCAAFLHQNKMRGISVCESIGTAERYARMTFDGLTSISLSGERRNGDDLFFFNQNTDKNK